MTIQKFATTAPHDFRFVGAVNRLIDGNMVIQNNGVDVAVQPILNFTNANSVTVDEANGRIDIETGGGGAGAPTSADYLVKTANGGLSAERVVTDTSTITWDWGTAGQAKANAATQVNAVSATVDFGANTQETNMTSVTVSASWVAAGSKIVCTPFAVATALHDPEDYAVVGLTAYASNISAGVGFDIIAFAPEGTFGTYTIHAVGV